MEHKIILRNLGCPRLHVKYIRIKPYTKNVDIGNVSLPTNWIQSQDEKNIVFSYRNPKKLEFNHFTDKSFSKRVTEETNTDVIPVGDPIQGIFAIDVKEQKGPQLIQIEWLDSDRSVLCNQILNITTDEKVNPRYRPPLPQKQCDCNCLTAATEIDEDSMQDNEPFISVDVETPEMIGFRKVSVPYTVEVEPPNVNFTRKWTVLYTDRTGDSTELQINPNETMIGNFDNSKFTGHAIFNLPGFGDYEFEVEVKAKMCNIEDGKRETADDSDFDSNSLRDSALDTKVEFASEPCDPKKYTFQDITKTPNCDPAVGINPVWTVTDISTGTPPLTLTPSSSGIVTYSFPTLGNDYVVKLQADDPNETMDVGGVATPVPRGLWIETITPHTNIIPKFKFDSYDSCNSPHKKPFKFYNISENIECPHTLEWDFGDGVTSSDQNPTHLFSQTGDHDVSLTITDTTTTPPTPYTDLQTVTIQQWTPDFTTVVCADGTLKIKASSDCYDFDSKNPNNQWELDGQVVETDILKFERKYDVTTSVVIKYTATNCFGGTCSRSRTVIVTVENDCIEKGKEKLIRTFNYDGTEYRTRSVFKFKGNRSQPKIIAKTKLQKKGFLGIWWRTKALSIGISINGTIQTEDLSTGCSCSNARIVAETYAPVFNKRLRCVHHYPGMGKFTADYLALTARFTIRVDANHNPGEIIDIVAPQP